MPPAVDHNARQLFGDVLGFGIQAGATLSFLPVYFAHLGASGFQVALITAGPAVMNLLLSLPSVRWLQGRSLLRVTFDMLVFNRLCYVPFLFLPWLVGPSTEIWVMVTLVSLAMVPGTLINVGFNAMFADLVPPEHRATVVGGRNSLMGLSTLVTSLLCGWLLKVVAFPLSYQIVFALGLFGLGISTFFLARLRDQHGHPPHRAHPLLAWPQAAAGRLVQIVRTTGQTLASPAGRPGLSAESARLDLLRGPFGLFLLAYFLFYTFQYVPVPLLPLFWVNQLHLSDSVISIGNGAFQLAVLATSAVLGAVAGRFGHKRVLVIAAGLYALQPLLNALATGVPLYLVSAIVGGIGWGFAGGTMATRLMERVPANDRPAHMALFNLSVYLGVLAGSFLGPVVGDWIGLRESLLVSGGLRIVAAVLMLIWA